MINQITDDRSRLYVGYLQKRFYGSRATTVSELIKLAIDNNVRNSSAITQELALALLNGCRLRVPKDANLLVGVEVGVDEGREENLSFVCHEYLRGTRLPAHHKFDVVMEGKFGLYHQSKNEEDFSAFGAAWKFVQAVGPVRAREALRSEKMQ